MDPVTRANRARWENASLKYHRESDYFRAIAADGSSLLDVERRILEPILRTGPLVVHPQSGNGTDDAALVTAGARAVIGIDYSENTVTAARRQARALDLPCHYLVAALPGAPLADGCADLVYTGKGALIWMPDLRAWARDVARLLRPGGHLFVYDGHPAAALWTWDEDAPRIRPDRGYFAPTYVNDSFPGSGAVERQHTLGEIVTAVAGAGLHVGHLAEYAEPFWRMGGVTAAAWAGRLPNSFSLLAVRADDRR
jgi:SAM-dependent methyltransferase